MLQVNVSQMLKGPVGSTRAIAIDDAIAVDEAPPSLVQGSANLTRTNRSILVQADISADVSLACARCLEHYYCPLRIKFDEEFFPATDVSSGLLLPNPEEAGAFTIDEHLTLDLAEAIRQYILTAIPMKPLCQSDCPGLKS